MIPYKGKVTLARTIKYIEDNMKYFWLDSLKTYDFSRLRFKLNEQDLSEIIIKAANEDFNLSYLDTLLDMCNSLGIDLVNDKNKKIMNQLVDLYFKNKYIFPEGKDFSNLMSSFNDKSLAVEFLRHIYSEKNIQDVEVTNKLINYLIKARQYYVDDRALLTSAINLINSVNEEDFTLGNSDKINKLTDKKIIEDKKANGIYNVDEFTLEELDKKLVEFGELASTLENLVEITDQQIKLMREESKKNNDEIAIIRLNTLKKLKQEANKILTNFDANYLELLNKEKESILHQKDILMADIETEIEKKKLELQAIASSVGQRIAIELGRIRQQSDYSIEQMQEFISNNEEVKKMFDVAKEDKAFLSRLAKMDNIPMPNINATGAVIAQTGIAVPNIIIPKEERIVSEKINYYFDKSIPFKDRFGQLMALKQEDIEKNGAIYHEKFDDLVTMVLNNNTPYMYGPSGCGKTFMVQKQFANLIGLNVVTNGYITYESDILGFNNANGIYVPSNFYRCYKYGDMLFLDELDNSISSSTVVLNSFIGKGEDSSYTFPDGDRIKRHPNFRILAAGNTRGNGRTVSHNTRQKLDEAVLQRLTPIEIDYDNRIEKKILEKYPDWYNFAINFRDALKEIKLDGNDGPNYKGTITTRDIVSIKGYKDDNSFSDDKIIEYEVIENKDPDYLNEILTEMERLEAEGKFTTGGKKLLTKFKTLSKGRKY